MEGVPAEHVDVVTHERGEPGHLLVADLEALSAELVEGCVHVAGGEQHQGVANTILG
ncbi:hypothetical protein OG322_40715 [Streptomyces sp. NBC_01260]|nr:hypothetical protein [Streptomyces sp. NBC_01260]